MSKYFLLMIFLLSFSNADLISFEQYGTKGNTTFAICVDSYYFDNQNNLIYSINSVSNTINLTNYENFNFDNRYILDSSNNCIIDSSMFGMTKEQYTFLMSLTGLLTGYMILFLVYKRF